MWCFMGFSVPLLAGVRVGLIRWVEEVSIPKASLRFGKISIVFEDLSRNTVFFFEPK